MRLKLFKKFFTKHKVFFFILIVAILIRVVYLGVTPYNIRTYDVMEDGGHLDYILYVQKNSSLPATADGWEFHQPPLYYIVSAIVYKASLTLNLDPELMLQVAALIYSIFFLIFVYKIIYLLLEENLSKEDNKFKSNMSETSRRILWMSMATISLWPSGIIHSIRIGNDPLFYCLYAISLYFIQKYYSKGGFINLIFASVFSAYTLITKANALALYIIIAIIFLITILNKHIRFKEIITAGLILSGGIFLGFFRNLYNFLTSQTKDWLMGNTSVKINQALRVSNQPINYLSFDFYTYLNYPFTSTWDDLYGRQYFWNFLLKTSLFAEYSFGSQIQYISAILMSILSIPFYLSVIIMIISLKKEEIKKYFVLILNLIVLVILLLMYRIREPYASNTDFRYIYPAIISLGFFAALWIGKLNTKSLFKRVGANFFIFSTIFILILSMLFFLNKI